MKDFSEIEDQLRGLCPLAPSENLVARIERALAEPTAGWTAPVAVDAKPGSRFLWYPSWPICQGISLGIGLAAAAVLLVFAVAELPSSREKVATFALRVPASVNAAKENSVSRFSPPDLTRVVYNTRDEGLLFPTGYDQPMRRVRVQKRETLQWHNLKTGASLRVCYPSEKISLIPISGE
jgi:hypothetical protein